MFDLEENSYDEPEAPPSTASDYGTGFKPYLDRNTGQFVYARPCVVCAGGYFAVYAEGVVPPDALHETGYFEHLPDEAFYRRYEPQ